MKKNPLVSVVIPVYKGDNYVREAIESVLKQTYKNIEIVVVNDGSPDEGKTRDACLEYEGKIAYYEKENGGCASAINYGIKMAKGDFISWLSHDDLYYPNKIEHQIKLYSEKKLDPKKVIVSNFGDLIDKDGKKIPHPTYGKTGFLASREAFRHLLFEKCFNGCGLLIPKNLFKDGFFFNEDMRFVLDWNLWLKFAIGGAEFYVDKEVLVSNRQHSAQVTQQQKELHSKEANETVYELFEFLKKERKELIADLYSFSFATGRGEAKQILEYAKNNDIKISQVDALSRKAKSRAVKLAKKVYHSLRGAIK